MMPQARILRSLKEAVEARAIIRTFDWTVKL
jgi:hypothetical protein